MNFHISTKVPRISLVTNDKVETVIKRLGHRKCLAYSSTEQGYYADGKWSESELEASIMNFDEMFEKTREYPLSLGITYIIINI